MFKNAKYKTRYKYFRSGIMYVQDWRVCELLKCILAIQKQLTNQPQVITNQTDHRWTFGTLWKTLKYLNINDSFHLKDLIISKYKRESKGRWPIKICRFIFVNCCLKSIKSVKIYAIRTKAVTWVRMRKKKPVVSNTGHFFCFNSTACYTWLWLTIRRKGTCWWIIVCSNLAAYIVCDIVHKHRYKLPSSNQHILQYLYFYSYQSRNNSWKFSWYIS